MIKGFKVFNPDFTCRGFKFEVGQTYEIKGALRLCENGFHFCLKANDCFEYYDFNSNNKVCEVEALGEVVQDDENTKCATSKILIVRELNWYEVLNLVNLGKDNTGRCNTGDRNTGDRNTGDRNTGDRNTGDRNTGDWNTGNCNTGDRNTGDRNTGDRNTGDWNTGNCNTGNCNTGDRNTGDRNTGDWNTGNCNTGNCNTGDRNTGDWNTGDCNTGNCNTGNCNTGDRNTGDWNTGNCNTGNCNTGDRNSGDFNLCNYSSGVFCTETPKLLIFDTPTEITLEDWRSSEPAWILRKLVLTEWIYSSNMSEEEKAINENYETTGGYLRKYQYKEAWLNLWNKLNDEEKDIIQRIPNFNKEKFQQITGIKLEKI